MKNVLSIVRPLLRVLPPGSRRFLLTYGILTAALALLDLVALGLVGTMLQTVLSDGQASLPLIGDLTTTAGQVTALVTVCGVIVLKGVFAVALLRAATRRFASHEVAIGDRLFAAYLASPWADRLSKNTSELVRTVDVGVGVTVAGVLIPTMTLFGEIGTMLAVVVAIVVFDPLIAAVTIVYLALVALLLAGIISPRAVAAGRENRDWSQRTVRVLSEALGALKEVTLAGRTPDVQARVHETRGHSSRARAEANFLGQVPRYVLETALILGFALIAGVGYLTGGPEGAVAAVGMFGVAGFRLVPSLTRMQTVQSTVNSNAAYARQVVADIDSSEALLERRSAERPQHELTVEHPDIVLDAVTFTYPGAETPALDRVSLRIPAGAHVAFVGSSGAGKSTMVDILLGLLEPTGGHLEVGGERLELVLDSWRRRIGYVPQDVSLFDATVAENVALTWEREKVEDDKVRRALQRAQLLDTVEAREGGIDARIGERGLAFSGGQRQRLGIARGLYNDPRVLVMDEATSALDTTTEAAVTRAIRDLHGEVTVITVAHRLATIRDSDIVFFLRDGRLVAQGSFAEVVAQVPDFAEQAALAGLSRTD
ncbi:ABC transporter ATP-binding protein [Georgenia satyanarayanai]|uniref:ABC transporter ATP-binding protein n=1 Tax=Georgenia satyanarayanai TaxID=860221 RepID=UPI00126596A1|nr:ABC transporter ATP-binding protein [Georgenia satyanarayanai]